MFPSSPDGFTLLPSTIWQVCVCVCVCVRQRSCVAPLICRKRSGWYGDPRHSQDDWGLSRRRRACVCVCVCVCVRERHCVTEAFRETDTSGASLLSLSPHLSVSLSRERWGNSHQFFFGMYFNFYNFPELSWPSKWNVVIKINVYFVSKLLFLGPWECWLLRVLWW